MCELKIVNFDLNLKIMNKLGNGVQSNFLEWNFIYPMVILEIQLKG